MNEIRILIICHLGLTSQILCQKIQSIAKAKELNICITSTSESEWKKYFSKADVILLEPQVAYLWKQIQPLAHEYQIQLAKVHPIAFATMDASDILEQALSLLEAKNHRDRKEDTNYD